jgi:hypothetical protein
LRKRFDFFGGLWYIIACNSLDLRGEGVSVKICASTSEFGPERCA